MEWVAVVFGFPLLLFVSLELLQRLASSEGFTSQAKKSKLPNGSRPSPLAQLQLSDSWSETCTKMPSRNMTMEAIQEPPTPSLQGLESLPSQQPFLKLPQGKTCRDCVHGALCLEMGCVANLESRVCVLKLNHFMGA